MILDYRCLRCGHDEDDHEHTGFYKPCTVPGCGCDDVEVPG